MALSELDSEIHARIQTFVEEISTLVRRSAIEAVAEALEGRARSTARGRAPRAISAASGTPRRRGKKRDPRELEALTSRLGDYIAKSPGQRIEEIGKALGVSTKALALPAKKLIAAKTVSTRGTRRATRYYTR